MPILKTYVALISQTGTNPPVLTELENTLGWDPTPSYAAVGGYFLTLDGAFAGNVVAEIGGQPMAFTDRAFVRKEDANRLLILTARAIAGSTGMNPADGILSPWTWLRVTVYE